MQFIISSAVANAAQRILGFTSIPDNDRPERQEQILWLLTVYVHGRQDAGLHLHERLLQQYCGKGTARLIEWDGDHRVPLKTKQIVVIMKQITGTGRETGVIKES